MCELTTGHTKPACRTVGGITKFIIYNLANRDGLTVASNIITGLSLAAGTQAYQFLVESELSSATETATSTRETTFYAQEAMMVLTEKTQATVDLNALLSKGFFGVIAFYESGLVRHFGLYKGMIANTTDSSGTAFADRNGYEFTFSCNETVTAPTISSTLAEALLTVAS